MANIHLFNNMENYKKQIKKDDNYLYYLNIKILIENGNYEKALNNLFDIYYTEPYNEGIKFELAKLLSIVGHLDSSLTLFEELCHKQKYRDASLLELGKICIRLGKTNEAMQYLKKLRGTSLEKEAKLLIPKVYAIEKNYEKGISYINRTFNQKYINSNKDLNLSLFYFKYMLGKISNNYIARGYFKKQLINYDEQEVIEHIKLHLDEDNQKVMHSVFCEGANIEYLLKIVKLYLDVLDKEYNGILDNYYIDLDTVVGKFHDYETSRLKVVTITGTQKIISMFPDTNLTKKIKTLNKK